MRVPLMWFTVEKSRDINRHFVGFGRWIAGLFPGLEYDLRDCGLNIDPGMYSTAVLLSSLIWGIIFYFFSAAVAYDRVADVNAASLYAAIPGVFFFALFFVVHMIYPRILARKSAERVDRDLVFALKDMHVQVSSGVTLYDAMVHVAQGGFGYVSEEFSRTVKQIAAGDSTDKALEAMALRIESKNLKKVVWQFVTAYQSGTKLSDVLARAVDSMTKFQQQSIRKFAGELNFLILIYMLFAVVIPTIGITLLIVLSVFGGLSITPDFFMSVVMGSFVLQIILVGYIRSRRPMVYA